MLDFFSWKRYAGHLGFHRFKAQGSLQSLKAVIYEEFSYTTDSHAKPTAVAWRLFKIHKNVHIKYP